MSAIKLRFVVEELSNVLTQYDQAKIYRSTTGQTGVYSEISGPGTRVPLVAGVSLYEFIDSAGSPNYWYKFAYFNSLTLAEGSLSAAIQGEHSGGLYCSVEDLRNEGITDAMASDARLTQLIRLASTMIERFTGRWFEPRFRTLRVTGRGSSFVHIDAPIIAIDAVSLIGGRGTTMSRDAVDMSGVLVYNRHLTEGLIEPDDRDNPRLEFSGAGSFWPGEFVWPAVGQVVEMVGYFGFTELAPGDPVGETSDGSQYPLTFGNTPALINRACQLLVARNLGPLGDPATASEWRDRWKITSERTADQSYNVADPTGQAGTGLVGAWTGDPEIDSIISMFSRPPSLGVA